MKKDFSWASTTNGQLFRDRYAVPLKTQHPDILKAMRTRWSLSQKQEWRLMEFAQASVENDFAVALHIIKFAPDKHPGKERAWLKIQDFMDAVYNDEKLADDITYYEDRISAFLSGNTRQLMHFTDFCSAWNTIPAQIKEAFKDDPGIDEPF